MAVLLKGETVMADKPLKVFAIEDNGGEKKYWHEVGVAFRNQDGSLNVKLYFQPLLKLQIREQTSKDEK
jgi:hypothetical protein